MSINDNILQEIGRCIREIIPDAKVFLFGSRALKENHRFADMDIGIIPKECV